MSTEIVTLYLEELTEIHFALEVAISDMGDTLERKMDPLERKQLEARRLWARTANKKVLLLRKKREAAPSANRGRPRVDSFWVPASTFVSNYNSLTAETELSQ